MSYQEHSGLWQGKVLNDLRVEEFQRIFAQLPLDALEFLMQKLDGGEIKESSPNSCYCGWLYRRDDPRVSVWTRAGDHGFVSEEAIAFISDTYRLSRGDVAALYWDCCENQVEAREALWRLTRS